MFAHREGSSIAPHPVPCSKTPRAAGPEPLSMPGTGKGQEQTGPAAAAVQLYSCRTEFFVQHARTRRAATARTCEIPSQHPFMVVPVTSGCLDAAPGYPPRLPSATALLRQSAALQMPRAPAGSGSRAPARSSSRIDQQIIPPSLTFHPPLTHRCLSTLLTLPIKISFMRDTYR